MPNKPNFRLLLVCVTLILSANAIALGCWCRYPGTVLNQFERSKSVIVGRLASVGEDEAALVVDRVYKGKLRVGDQLKFVQGTFGDCLRGFSSEEIGQQYLFYLNEPPNAKVYTASICNRSNKIARAFADMAYLDNIDSVANKTRVYGYFKTDEKITQNVEGLVITITQLKTKNAYSVTTDNNGFFEVYNLAPGEYKLEPKVPSGWRIDEKEFFGIDSDPSWRVHAIAVTVKAKKDAEIRIPIVRDRTVGGYPSVWFAPINDSKKPDWEILPQEAKAGEVILSKRNELGVLSNFAATPFEMDGKRYASVEGFWQMMLYPEGPDDERAKDKRVTWKYTREQVAQMTAFEAKQAGTLAEENMKTLGIDWVTYNGKRFPYRSQNPGEHYRLIVAAMRAKLEQNPEVKRVLLATGDLILKPDHHGETDAPPEWKYFDIWMQNRSELLKKS